MIAYPYEESHVTPTWCWSLEATEAARWKTAREKMATTTRCLKRARVSVTLELLPEKRYCSSVMEALICEDTEAPRTFRGRNLTPLRPGM